MKYEIYTITDKSKLSDCPVFVIDKYNWGGNYRPVTYGRMAYLEGQGFIIRMICEEEEPLRTYVNNEDPVYLDSAMEAFIEFAPDTRKGTYINIEMNANGATLHHYGLISPGRKVYTELTDARCTVKASIDENSWSTEVFIPLQYVKDLFGRDTFKPGDRIRCNFYKICESEGSKQHYGSYTEIVNPTPNFHLPEFFAEGVIV